MPFHFRCLMHSFCHISLQIRHAVIQASYILLLLLYIVHTIVDFVDMKVRLVYSPLLYPCGSTLIRVLLLFLRSVHSCQWTSAWHICYYFINGLFPIKHVIIYCQRDSVLLRESRLKIITLMQIILNALDTLRKLPTYVSLVKLQKFAAPVNWFKSEIYCYCKSNNFPMLCFRYVFNSNVRNRLQVILQKLN